MSDPTLIVVISLIVYITGVYMAYAHDIGCMDWDEAVFWPIYAIKWLLKGLWKAIFSW